MFNNSIDRDLSLEEIEHEYWGEPDYDSYIVINCHALRRKPLKELTVEDLRLAIGQPPFEKSLCYLVPLAIEFLRDDPTAMGVHYNGDLLKNVLRISNRYWSSFPEQVEEIAKIIALLYDLRGCVYDEFDQLSIGLDIDSAISCNEKEIENFKNLYMK